MASEMFPLIPTLLAVVRAGYEYEQACKETERANQAQIQASKRLSEARSEHQRWEREQVRQYREERFAFGPPASPS